MKRIRKIETSVGVTGNVTNSESTSTVNTYSCEYINELKTAILDSAFPVGKVEVFFDNEDHSNYLGFQWERTLQGLTPVGIQSTDTDFATIGKTGGAKTVNLQHTHSYAHTHGVPGVAHTHSTGNHTLTTSEMPSHTHNLVQETMGHNRDWAPGVAGYYNNRSPLGGNIHIPQIVTTDGNTDNMMFNGNTGGGGAHNHGNTGSTTPNAATTNSQSTSTSGNAGSTTQSIMQPYGVVAYWKRIR